MNWRVIRLLAFLKVVTSRWTDITRFPSVPSYSFCANFRLVQGGRSNAWLPPSWSHLCAVYRPVQRHIPIQYVEYPQCTSLLTLRQGASCWLGQGGGRAALFPSSFRGSCRCSCFNSVLSSWLLTCLCHAWVLLRILAFSRPDTSPRLAYYYYFLLHQFLWIKFMFTFLYYLTHHSNSNPSNPLHDI